MPEPRRQLYGRHKGKPLSPARERLMDDLLPRLRLDVGSPPPADVADLFDNVADVHVEIGFGGGEHLVAKAGAHPQRGFIGVEPFVYGLSRAVHDIDRLGLHNVRLYDDDAAFLLAWLPDASIARVELPFPDPWPKRRHHKRRFVNPANLDRLARVLKPGGTFLVATDWAGYADWTLQRVRSHPAFAWTARRAADWREPPPGWTTTRYQAKAATAGRASVFLEFLRI